MEYTLGLYEKATPDSTTIPEKLAAAKAAGFDHLELSIDEKDWRQERLMWTPEERTGIVEAIKRTGIPLRTLCLSGHRRWPFGSHDPEVRAYATTMLERAVDLSCDLGTEIIMLAGYDVFYETGDKDTLAWFEDGLRRAVEYAEGRGIVLAFETMETGYLIDTIAKAKHWVDLVDSPFLRIYPDLGNITNACERYGTSIADDIASGGDTLVAMHLKDTVTDVFRDLRFGEGRVDFEVGIPLALKAGVRLFTAEMWDDGRENWQEGLAEANAFLRTRIEGAIEAL
ncbi:MAG: L-ribulose-5-phosphate 3-epimerase [Atopobiaceae bacterium]|nr:L-ribulose-5-phosphate 3-epimerase [Atopobiaceae bacterium]